MNEYLEGFSVEDIISHNKFQEETIDYSMFDFRGEYTYIDFLDESDIEGWTYGKTCASLKNEMNYSWGENTLKADFVTHSSNEKTGELYYTYKLSENFSYAPYLIASLMIETQDNNSIFAISITLFGENEHLELSTTVYANELCDISFNVDEFSKNNKVRSIKISVKEITSTSHDFSLWIQNIRGHSVKYSTDEIEQLIYEDRIKNANNNLNTDESAEKIEYGIILGVAFAIISIGIGLFMSLRKDASEK